MFDRFNIFLPRKAVQAEFHRPARLDERLRVATYIGRVGTSSMTINFDVLRDTASTLIAAARQVLVCADRVTLKSKPIPREIITALGAHTLSEAAARAALQVEA